MLTCMWVRGTTPTFLGRSCTMDDALQVLRDVGASAAAVCPTDQCKNSELVSEAERVCAKDRSISIWTLPWMRAFDSAEGRSDLDFLQSNLARVAGIKIHPSLTRKPITDDVFDAVLQEVAGAGKVVLVHCGRWQEVASYRFAVEAAIRHPGAKFLLAHGGGDTPPLATSAAQLVAEKKVNNVWFEFSGLREYWVIERNVALLGAERYLMGSDYNLAHPRMYMGAIEAMSIASADKDKILGENAANLFGGAT